MPKAGGHVYSRYSVNSFTAIELVAMLVSQYPPETNTMQSLVVRRLRELVLKECHSGEEQLAFVLAVMVHLRDENYSIKERLDRLFAWCDGELDGRIAEVLRLYFLHPGREWCNITRTVNVLVKEAFLGAFAPARERKM